MTHPSPRRARFWILHLGLLHEKEVEFFLGGSVGPLVFIANFVTTQFTTVFDLTTASIAKRTFRFCVARGGCSQNQNMRLALFAFIGFFFVCGCASNASKQQSKISDDRQRVREILSGEISLKDDRAKLDSLRKNVPDQKKKENDELASFFLKNTMELKDDPSDCARALADPDSKETIEVQRGRGQIETRL